MKNETVTSINVAAIQDTTKPLAWPEWDRRFFLVTDPEWACHYK